MTFWRKAILLGLLVWPAPFVVARCAFPAKVTWRSLFESIMPLCLTIVVVGCSLWYFRCVPRPLLGEGLGLGLLWLAISVAIDLPLMLPPPISYDPAEYAADIGLMYVMIPMITAGIAVAAGRGATQTFAVNAADGAKGRLSSAVTATSPPRWHPLVPGGGGA